MGVDMILFHAQLMNYQQRYKILCIKNISSGYGVAIKGRCVGQFTRAFCKVLLIRC